MRQIYRVAGADLDPPRSRSTCRSTGPSGRSRGRRPPIWRCSAWRSRPIRTSSTARTGCSPGPRTPRPPRSCASRTSSFPTSSRSPIHPAHAGGALRFALPDAALPAARQGPPAKFQLRLRYNSTGAGDRSTLDLGRAADPGGQRAALRCRAGGWSGESTTRSPTSWARSPSSIPTRSSAAAPPRSPPGSRSRGSSRLPRRRSSGSRPATRWATSAPST